MEAADDQHHEEAIKHWRGLLRKVPALVTTTYVVNEIATFFNSRNRHAKAVEIINRLKSSSSVQIVHVGEKLFDASLRVKDVRRQLGLSQEQLAHALGASFATVNRWENGKTKPSKLARMQLDQLCKEKNIAPSINPLRRKHSS